MSLSDSFFVTTTVHPRTVTLADGQSYELHFKEVPATVWRRFMLAENAGGENARAEAIQRLIAASLCEADGTPAITVEKALELKPQPMMALFQAVLAVHGKDPEKVEAEQGNG